MNVGVVDSAMKLFQINEDDLAELERSVPELCQVLSDERLDNRLRAMIRRVQRIIVNVRWDYGPPGEVETIPADEPPTT